MGDVVCKKCGAEAHSKCPYCRNVFPDDQIATLYNNLITLTVKPPETQEYLGGEKATIQKVNFSLDLIHYPEDKDTPEEHTLSLLKGLLKLEQPIQAICDHSWKFKPGVQSSIGCGHGSKEEEVPVGQPT